MLRVRTPRSRAMPSSRNRLTRRAVIAGATAGTVALAADPASAQRRPSAPRTKGPRVWLDMDQQDLNEAYDQSVYAFNVENIQAREQETSDAALAQLVPSRVAYGTSDIEALTIFRAARANAPTLIFIHGGAWGDISSSRYAYLAENFVTAGAHFVAVDFIDVGRAGGNLFPMVDQCRRAVAWVYRNAASFGGSSSRIYLSGHSSGAHLAACVLTSDGASEALPADIVKGAVLASGIYDLKPVRLSNRSSYVKFTDEMEHALSPQRHVDRIRTPLILAYGTLETPEFQRHSRDFAAALTSAAKPVRLLPGKGYNHFDALETLANPYGFMGRAALEMLNLAT
jgi:arylformamidase